eukprot:scaffold124841_cov16-Prasinocladus_malaysianus.AAC.1
MAAAAAHRRGLPAGLNWPGSNNSPGNTSWYRHKNQSAKDSTKSTAQETVFFVAAATLATPPTTATMTITHISSVNHRKATADLTFACDQSAACPCILLSCKSLQKDVVHVMAALSSINTDDHHCHSCSQPVQ